MAPPTNIDGTDITGATIDGQEVTEITVDGQTVFSAGPTLLFTEDFESGIGAWSRSDGNADFSTTSFASQGSSALRVHEEDSNTNITRPINLTFSGTIKVEFDFAEDRPADFGVWGFSDDTGSAAYDVFRVVANNGPVTVETGGGRVNFSDIPDNQYVPFAITLDFDNQQITEATINGQTKTQTEPFLGTGNADFLKLRCGDNNGTFFWDNIRISQL